MKDSDSDMISLHGYNNFPYKISLPLGLSGYCETNATDICQSTVFHNELPQINHIFSSHA